MSANLTSVFLKKHRLFSGLDEKQMEDISAFVRQHVLKKGKRISIHPLQSNRIYFLVNGKMKLAGSVRDHHHAVKDLVHAGEMFGNISFSEYAEEEYVEALVNNTLVYCIGVPEFRQLLRQHHRLALNFSENITRKLSLLKERYLVWTKQDSKARLVYLLQHWARTDGERQGNLVILPNYLTLTDLADILSVSRQFLYILLKNLDRAGLLKYSRRQIELHVSLLENSELD